LRVTLSLAAVLLLTAWNLVRFRTAIAWESLFSEVGARPGATYVAATGAIWGVVGLVALAGSMAAKPWAGYVLGLSAAFYSIWYWLDRVLLQPPRASWPFTLLLNAGLLALLLSTGYSMTKERHD